MSAAAPTPDPAPAPAPPAAPKGPSFLKRLLGGVGGLVPLARFAYKNRKAEIALAAAVVALVREAVQAATGH